MPPSFRSASKSASRFFSGFQESLSPGARLVIYGVVALGLAERIGWLLLRKTTGASGEAFNVARALAEGRGFADAYQIGQGPTAHLLPLSPAIAGIVYRLFGVHSILAEAILACWALLLVFGTFLLLFRAFGLLGTPAWARIGALAWLCISPAYLAQETVDFRIWEGGLAALLAAFLLERLLVLKTAEDIGTRGLLVIAAVAALLFFVNPALGLAGYCCALLFSWQRLSRRQVLYAGAATIGLLVCLVGPWALRNKAELGQAVLLRSNSGLELAMAQHEAAWSDPDRGKVFKDRLMTIHPALNGDAFARLQSLGGEIAYSKALGDEAYSWMAEHPIESAMLTARHLRQIFLPEPWQFTTFGTGQLAGMRALLAGTAGLLGCTGLFIALILRPASWAYPALLIVVPALALAMFQPVPRYIYLFYPPLAFCAAHLLSLVVRQWLRFESARSPSTSRVKGLPG